jgi:hypothetical protein
MIFPAGRLGKKSPLKFRPGPSIVATPPLANGLLPRHHPCGLFL